jgi:hypothetical protein
MVCTSLQDSSITKGVLANLRSVGAVNRREYEHNIQSYVVLCFYVPDKIPRRSAYVIRHTRQPDLSDEQERLRGGLLVFFVQVAGTLPLL